MIDARGNPEAESMTAPDEWEKITITMGDMLAMNLSDESMPEVLERYRDWMLGGKLCEWRYSKDKLNGDITLWRR